MRIMKNLAATLCIFLTAALTLTSCTEDWLYSEADLYGRWSIEETSFNHAYMPGDQWIFSPNGNFYAYAATLESGRWRTNSSSRITIYFPDAEGMDVYVRHYDRDRGIMEVDVTDYDNRENYRLLLYYMSAY